MNTLLQSTNCMFHSCCFHHFGNIRGCLRDPMEEEETHPFVQSQVLLKKIIYERKYETRESLWNELYELQSPEEKALERSKSSIMKFKTKSQQFCC